METIPTQQLLDIISHEYGVELDLDLGHVVRFHFDTSTYYGITTADPGEFEKVFPGRLLVEVGEQGLTIFPALLDYITNLPRLSLNPSQTLEITRGKSIKHTSSSGHYLVVDRRGDLIALGKQEQNKLIPISDLGLYLRFETRGTK